MSWSLLLIDGGMWSGEPLAMRYDLSVWLPGVTGIRLT